MTSRSIVSTLGHDVIAVDSAESIGEVKSFVVSPHVDRIDKIHIAGRKKHALFAAWADLRSFGDDAVMVTRSDAAAEAEGDRDIDVARGDIDIIGARVLDTAGFDRGQVVDVNFDSDSGAIESLTVGNTSVPAAAVHSIGSFAVVIDA